jgi:hypothetical protein
VNEREMFEQSFKRPSYYFRLSSKEQTRIDKELDILDWKGNDLTKEDKQRFFRHYLKGCEVCGGLEFDGISCKSCGVRIKEHMLF